MKKDLNEKLNNYVRKIKYVGLASFMLMNSGCTLVNKAIEGNIEEKLELEAHEDSVTGFIVDSSENLKKVLKKAAKEQFVYIKMENDQIDEDLFKSLSEVTNVGIIVEPNDDCTYASLFHTIDSIKSYLSKYEINLPILYDINPLQASDHTKRANVLLAQMFCDKLGANGCYVGLYGNDENMVEFDERYRRECKSNSIDIYDKVVVTDDENQLSYDGVFNMIKVGFNNTIYQKFDIINVIKENNLNRPEGFVGDLKVSVVEGDNLSSIAEHYGIKLKDLKDYNNLLGDRIYPGDTIVIPNIYGSSYSEINTPIPNVDYFEYVVMPQDSLSGIAEAYGLDVYYLAQYNNIYDINYLELGQVLKIPVLNNAFVLDNEFDNIDNADDSYYIFNPNEVLKGIDVSEYQGDIDWNKVSEKSDFTIIRLLDFYHYNNTGFIDKQFEYNLVNSEINNLDNGIYYVSYGTSMEEQRKEARFVMSLLEEFKTKYNCNFEYPIYLDMEAGEYSPLYTTYFNEGKYDELAKVLDAGLSEFTKNGYHVGIYSSDHVIKVLENTYLAEKYEMWTTSGSSYNTSVEIDEVEGIIPPNYYPSNKESAIQITQVGKCAGINGDVDIDVATSSLVKKTKTGNYSN